MEVLVPFVVDYTKDHMQEKKQQKGYGQLLARFEPEEQIDFGAYADTIDDMSEIIVQYGYVPITPLFPSINNTFETKVDAYNLIRQSQRPHPNGSSGSGAWHAILGFFSIVAVATNVELLTWPTSVVKYLTSLAGDSISNNFDAIIIVVAVFCFVCVAWILELYLEFCFYLCCFVWCILGQRYL